MNQLTHERPAPDQLLSLMLGMVRTQAVHYAVKLHLADLIEIDGRKSVADLARLTGTHAGALHRLLRTLASINIFRESAECEYEHTELSKWLRKTSPFHTLALMHGSEWQWRPWEMFDYSLRTGKPALNEVYGFSIWDYFETHQEEGRIFNSAMKSFSSQMDGPLVEAYDFSPFAEVMDVGCGTGAMLCTILARFSACRGIFFDRHEVLQQEKDEILQAFPDRVSFVAGNFFQNTLPKAHCIALRQIIKDWDDDRASMILRNCAQALKPHGRILIIEVIIPKDPRAMELQTLIDLQLMAVLNGRERTESEFRALIHSAGGLLLERIIPIPATPYSILEVVQ